MTQFINWKVAAFLFLLILVATQATMLPPFRSAPPGATCTTWRQMSNSFLQVVVHEFGCQGINMPHIMEWSVWMCPYDATEDMPTNITERYTPDLSQCVLDDMNGSDY